MTRIKEDPEEGESVYQDDNGREWRIPTADKNLLEMLSDNFIRQMMGNPQRFSDLILEILRNEHNARIPGARNRSKGGRTK